MSDVTPSGLGIAAQPKLATMAYAEPLRLALTVVFVSLLSVLMTGYRGGENNNLFHLPVLEALWREPQFAHDAFVQSMRYYASGFWMLQVGVADDSTAMSLLFGWMIVSRLLFFTGILLMARPLGVQSPRGQALFVLIGACSCMLLGVAPAGYGGLMQPSFTHSELDNGLMLMSLGLAWRLRYGWALALAGLMFFINIFMAVWFGPLLIGAAWLHVRAGRLTVPQLLQRSWLGALVCVALAIPVLLNVAHNPDFGHKPDYDFRVFLEEYFALHFLIWKTPADELLKLAICLGVGFGAARQLPRDSGRFVALMIALSLGVWLVGVVLPYMTSSPMLLNLELLRSSVYIAMLGALALNAFIARLMEGEAQERTWGALLLVLGVSVLYSLAAFLPLLWLRRRLAVRLPAPRLAFLALLAIALGLVGSRGFIQHKHQVAYYSAQARWLEVGRWARTRTAPDTTFLLSDELFRNPDAYSDNPILGYQVFLTVSHRPMWFNWKYGAAAMWLQSYYDQWWARSQERSSLTDLPARIAYARVHHVGVVVDTCDKRGAVQPAFSADNNVCTFLVD